MNFITNLFKIARLLSTDDSGDFQIGIAKALGKEQKVMLFTPYGLMNHPPENSFVCLWNQMGKESNGIGIADDTPNRIFKDLEEGEVALGNYVTGDYVKFDVDGNMMIWNEKTSNKIQFQDDGDIVVQNGTSNAFFKISNGGTIQLYQDATHYIQMTGAGVATIEATTINLNGDVVVDGELTVINGGLWVADDAKVVAHGTAGYKSIGRTHTHGGGAVPD